MAYPYPITEPYSSGKLDVADGHKVHWEVAGNPDGKPAVLLHGGPGSGSTPGHRRMFNPDKYMIVQFDQRNCGQSTPNAGEFRIDLSTNTTQHLIADIEQLRTALDVDRWLVWGGSWGTTLALPTHRHTPTRSPSSCLEVSSPPLEPRSSGSPERWDGSSPSGGTTFMTFCLPIPETVNLLRHTTAS
jgi:proline iminopeptidase